ncbi:MAG: HAD-IA family hydrolase [Alteromonadaceae bacterium]|nr:HAD-IA family hydrolase [Alteromonadaceae bacterium]
MRTIIFGGLGVIAETSEIHRAAFNRALSEIGLPWEWSQAEYQKMLNSPGGKNRLTEFLVNQDPKLVNYAEIVHTLKSRFYLQALSEQTIEPRTGLVNLFSRLETKEVRFAIASTTSLENIYGLLDACNIPLNQFAVIASKTDVEQPKPAPDIYDYVLSELCAIQSNCVAIEDSASGVIAAVAAGVTCYAMPGLNTANQDYSEAEKILIDYTELD